jgi:osmotically-inducible protein OsmY
MRVLAVLAGLLLLFSLTFAADPVSDDSLYDQVRLRLASDREVGRSKIDVKVTSGVVELLGRVRTDRLKERAEKIAKKVKGVQKVVNSLQIEPI